MTLVVPVPIPTGPPVPDSTSVEATFDAQFEASLTWQRNELTPKANALAAASYINAQHSEAQALAAEAAKLIAVNSSAQALGAVGYKGLWSGLTGALNMPASVTHEGRLWLLSQNTANVAADVPGVSAKWQAYDTVFPLAEPVVSSGVTTYQLLTNWHYSTVWLNNVELLLPVNPQAGAVQVITVWSDDHYIVINPGLKTIESIADKCRLDRAKTYVLRYMPSMTWKFI